MEKSKTQTVDSGVKPAGEKAPGRFPEKFDELGKNIGNMGQDTAWKVDKRVGKISGTGIDVAHTRSDLSPNVKKSLVD